VSTVSHSRASLFLFPRPGDHPDLHSFPTRRSSDLGALHLAPRAAAGAEPHALASLALPPDGLADAFELLRHALVGGHDLIERVRSEEHTSELQSQSNLVCRLLLEKKKQYKCLLRHP